MDGVAKKGRPKLPSAPKMSCLRKEPVVYSNGLRKDNTLWHKNLESSYGLKVAKNKIKTNTKPKVGDFRPKGKWKTHCGIDLTEEDKYILLKNDEWISDSIINASQSLLQKQYPHIKSLQNVCLSQIDGNKQIDFNKHFEFQKEIKKLTQIKRKAVSIIEKLNKTPNTNQTEKEIEKMEKTLAQNEKLLKETEESLSRASKFEITVQGLQPLEWKSRFVQIILDETKDRSHWICVSNVMTKHWKTVRIYDNDLQAVDFSIKNYSLSLRNVLKRLFRNSENIKLELPVVSQMVDNCSGGVYAIAFAQALCEGVDPSDILFSPSSKIMRAHLFSALEMAYIGRFPTGRTSSIGVFSVIRSHKEKPNFSPNPKPQQ